MRFIRGKSRQHCGKHKQDKGDASHNAANYITKITLRKKRKLKTIQVVKVNQ